MELKDLVKYYVPMRMEGSSPPNWEVVFGYDISKFKGYNVDEVRVALNLTQLWLSQGPRVYLGHLVRQCNCAGETANTGVFASEGLQIVMCLLNRLKMGNTLLKFERTVATALLCNTAWHTAIPGQAFAKEVCESLLSSLVTKKGQNRDAVTIEDVDDLYHLITIRKKVTG